MPPSVPTLLEDGIALLPLPLPLVSPRRVNAYVINTPGGPLLVDCGADWPEGRAALVDGLAALGFELADVRTLVVTHLHLDHVGLAGFVAAASGCEIVMHRRADVDRYNDSPRMAEEALALARRHGAPADLLDVVAASTARPPHMAFAPPPTRIVDDGDRISLGADRVLEVLHTPGHEPSHVCLRDSRSGAIFSGDHVLPRFLPAVLYDGTTPDPMENHLTSLRRIIDLGPVRTYPAHGSVLADGAARAAEIARRRLAQAEDILARVSVAEATAWELATATTRAASSRLRFHLFETVSHLERLRLAASLTVDESALTWHYRPTR